MKNVIRISIILSVLSLMTGCGGKKEKIAELQQRVDSLQLALKPFATASDTSTVQLARMDSLDFVLFNNQQWDAFSNIIDPNIEVFYPNGATSIALPQYTDMMKQMFAYAPDTKIISHKVKFGNSEWSAVVGEVAGTFTDTMITAEGKQYLPNGKTFKFSLCTLAHWRNGKIMDEYLFWDNESFMKQLDLVEMKAKK